jgi:uncharacterized protein YcbX
MNILSALIRLTRVTMSLVKPTSRCVCDSVSREDWLRGEDLP